MKATTVSGAGSTAALADLADLVLNVARELRFPVPDDLPAIRLTPSEGNVMRFIDRHPGATPSEVAHATGLRRSNLSAALRLLEDRGLVERRADPADGRTVRLEPTVLAASNLSMLREQWSKRMSAALGGNRYRVEHCIELLTQLEAGLVQGRQQTDTSTGSPGI